MQALSPNTKIKERTLYTRHTFFREKIESFAMPKKWKQERHSQGRHQKGCNNLEKLENLTEKNDQKADRFQKLKEQSMTIRGLGIYRSHKKGRI